MKHIPGNKSLVLFSGRDLGPSGIALGRAFADAGTPVYAINTKNWIMRGFFTRVKRPHIYEEHSLKDFSLSSGGEYFADVKDIETISQDVHALTGNYYVLGYYIKEDWDGRFHEIDVGVRRPGLRVLTGEGYYNSKPFAEMSEFEKDLHLFDLIYSEEPVLGDASEIPVAVLDYGMTGGHHGVVLLEFTVDPKSGVSPSRVELFAFIRDEDRIPIVSSKWDFDLSKYDGQTLVLCLCKPFEPGEYDGRVVVRDIVTGRSSVGRSAFEVGAPSAETIVLSSPVIIVSGAATKIANLPLEKKRRGGAGERNFIQLYPFIPRDHRIVVGELDYGTEHIQAVVPIRLKVTDQQNPPRLQFTARLVPREGGDRMPLDLKVIDAQSVEDGREFWIMDISLPPLKRGEYELVITAEDIDTEKSASVRTPLVIK
jgi:hypothetical protein